MSNMSDAINKSKREFAIEKIKEYASPAYVAKMNAGRKDIPFFGEAVALEMIRSYLDYLED